MFALIAGKNKSNNLFRVIPEDRQLILHFLHRPKAELFVTDLNNGENPEMFLSKQSHSCVMLSTVAHADPKGYFYSTSFNHCFFRKV